MPATRTSPESGRDKVVRILTVVDLPAPFGPEQTEDGAGGDADGQLIESLDWRRHHAGPGRS